MQPHRFSVRLRSDAGIVTPTFLSASFEAFVPREPQGLETSQLADPKVGVTKKSEVRHRFASAFYCLTILVLALFAWAFAPQSLAQNAPASPSTVQINLKGTGQAKYALDLGNGAEDQIELNWKVNLQFTPQNLLKSGNLVVSHQASFTGSFRI